MISRSLAVVGGVFGLICMAAPALAKVEVRQEGTQTIYSFEVEGVVFDEVEIGGETFAKPRLMGVDGYAGIDYSVGKPELPVIRILVTGDATVTEAASSDAFAAIPDGRRIKPAQPGRVKRPGPAPELVLDEAAYAGGFRARHPYELAPAGSVQGRPQTLVTLYPFHYAPAEGRYGWASRFEVRVVAPKVDAPSRELFAFVVGARFRSSPALARYATLKEELGYAVEYVHVTAADNADSIRAQLKTLYARSDVQLAHALLIGDAADVPSKTSSVISGVTDHYFRAIDTANYAADINGPDIGVGRVAVQTEEQLATVLGKFERYQAGDFAREGWLNGVAFLATDDQWELAEGTHDYAVATHTAPGGYMGIFPGTPQLGGDKLYAVTHRVTNAKVMEAMRLGRTIIDYSGHGSTTSWAVPSVSQGNVRSLTDRDALPFVIGNACDTGDFRTPESFGETWQRHEAGAIMYWGSMDSSYWDEDDILERAMFDGIYAGGKSTFAAITDYASSELWRHYGGAGFSKYYWETYVTFGDPSLALRTTPTRVLSVAGPASLPVGAATAEYTVTDANGPVAGARVALTLPGGAFAEAAVTDARGVARFDISVAARNPITFKVNTSGVNLRTVSGELRIVP